MKEIILDRKKLEKPRRCVRFFLSRRGIAQWHGRNFDAFNDSIATGSINEIEFRTGSRSRTTNSLATKQRRR